MANLGPPAQLQCRAGASPAPCSGRAGLCARLTGLPAHSLPLQAGQKRRWAVPLCCTQPSGCCLDTSLGTPSLSETLRVRPLAGLAPAALCPRQSCSSQRGVCQLRVLSAPLHQVCRDLWVQTGPALGSRAQRSLPRAQQPGCMEHAQLWMPCLVLGTGNTHARPFSSGWQSQCWAGAALSLRC